MTSLIFFKINKSGTEVINGVNLIKDYGDYTISEKASSTLKKGKVTRSETSQPDAEGNVFLTLVIES